MSADTTSSIAQVQDEDVLKRMWQETDDFGKKKEIRSHMYKLREERLKNFYSNTSKSSEEIHRSQTSTSYHDSNLKDGNGPNHADSLADHSFLSMKCKEIRDSESPTRDVHYKGSPDKPRYSDQGWQVTEKNESSVDGKTHTTSRIATTGGSDKINGGVASYAAKCEQTASVYSDGDANNFTKSTAGASRNVIQQEAKGGDDNSSFHSYSTSSNSSSKVVTHHKSTNETLNDPKALPSSDDSGMSVVRKVYTSDVPDQLKKSPNYIDGNTKVTTETRTLPDGTKVTTTRYETKGSTTIASTDNRQTKQFVSEQTSSTIKSTSDKSNIDHRVIEGSKLIPTTIDGSTGVTTNNNQTKSNTVQESQKTAKNIIQMQHVPDDVHNIRIIQEKEYIPREYCPDYELSPNERQTTTKTVVEKVTKTTDLKSSRDVSNSQQNEQIVYHTKELDLDRPPSSQGRTTAVMHKETLMRDDNVRNQNFKGTVDDHVPRNDQDNLYVTKTITETISRGDQPKDDNRPDSPNVYTTTTHVDNQNVTANKFVSENNTYRTSPQYEVTEKPTGRRPSPRDACEVYSTTTTHADNQKVTSNKFVNENNTYQTSLQYETPEKPTGGKPSPRDHSRPDTDDVHAIKTITITRVDNEQFINENNRPQYHEATEKPTVGTPSPRDDNKPDSCDVYTTKTTTTAHVDNRKIISDKFVNENNKYQTSTQNEVPETPSPRDNSKPDTCDAYTTKTTTTTTTHVDKFTDEDKPEKPTSTRPIQPETDRKTTTTENRQQTTYRTDYVSKRISVDVSPTHEAFARSLRAVSPDRDKKKNSTRSLKSSTSSLRSSTSPEKCQPGRITPDRTNRKPLVDSKRTTPDRHSVSPTRQSPTRRVPQDTIKTNSITRHHKEKTNTVIDSATLTRRPKNRPRSRSASPTTSASEIEYVKTCDLKPRDSPYSLEVTTSSRKVIERSTTTPITGSKRCPTKPQEKPFIRRDTYEERCRQMLGIETNKVKKQTVPNKRSPTKDIQEFPSQVRHPSKPPSPVKQRPVNEKSATQEFPYQTRSPKKSPDAATTPTVYGKQPRQPYSQKDLPVEEPMFTKRLISALCDDEETLPKRDAPFEPDSYQPHRTVKKDSPEKDVYGTPRGRTPVDATFIDTERIDTDITISKYDAQRQREKSPEKTDRRSPSRKEIIETTTTKYVNKNKPSRPDSPEESTPITEYTDEYCTNKVTSTRTKDEIIKPTNKQEPNKYTPGLQGRKPTSPERTSLHRTIPKYQTCPTEFVDEYSKTITIESTEDSRVLQEYPSRCGKQPVSKIPTRGVCERTSPERASPHRATPKDQTEYTDEYSVDEVTTHRTKDVTVEGHSYRPTNNQRQPRDDLPGHQKPRSGKPDKDSPRLQEYPSQGKKQPDDKKPKREICERTSPDRTSPHRTTPKQYTDEYTVDEVTTTHRTDDVTFEVTKGRPYRPTNNQRQPRDDLPEHQKPRSGKPDKDSPRLQEYPSQGKKQPDDKKPKREICERTSPDRTSPHRTTPKQYTDEYTVDEVTTTHRTDDVTFEVTKGRPYRPTNNQREPCDDFPETQKPKPGKYTTEIQEYPSRGGKQPDHKKPVKEICDRMSPERTSLYKTTPKYQTEYINEYNVDEVSTHRNDDLTIETTKGHPYKPITNQEEPHETRKPKPSSYTSGIQEYPSQGRKQPDNKKPVKGIYGCTSPERTSPHRTTPKYQTEYTDEYSVDEVTTTTIETTKGRSYRPTSIQKEPHENSHKPDKPSKYTPDIKEYPSQGKKRPDNQRPTKEICGRTSPEHKSPHRSTPKYQTEYTDEYSVDEVTTTDDVTIETTKGHPGKPTGNQREPRENQKPKPSQYTRGIQEYPSPGKKQPDNKKPTREICKERTSPHRNTPKSQTSLHSTTQYTDDYRIKQTTHSTDSAEDHYYRPTNNQREPRENLSKNQEPASRPGKPTKHFSGLQEHPYQDRKLPDNKKSTFSDRTSPHQTTSKNQMTPNTFNHLTNTQQDETTRTKTSQLTKVTLKKIPTNLKDNTIVSQRLTQTTSHKTRPDTEGNHQLLKHKPNITTTKSATQKILQKPKKEDSNPKTSSTSNRSTFKSKTLTEAQPLVGSKKNSKIDQRFVLNKLDSTTRNDEKISQQQSPFNIGTEKEPNKISATSTTQKLPTNIKQSPTQDDLSLKPQEDVDNQIESFESNSTDDSLNKSVNFNEESLDGNFLNKKISMIKKVFGKSPKEGRTATSTKDAKSVMDNPEGVPQIQNKKPSKPQSNDPNTTKEPNVEAERPKTTDNTQTSQITISYATEGFGEPEMTMPTSSIKYLKTPTQDSEDNNVTTHYTTEVIEQSIEPLSEVQMLKQISRPHTIETQSTDLRPRKENTNRQGPSNKPEDADQMITDKKTTGKDLVDNFSVQPTEYNPKQTTLKQSNIKALKLEGENLKRPNQKPHCKISTEVSEDFIDRPSPIETYDKQAYKPEAIKTTHFTDQSFRQPTLAKQKDEAVGKQLDEPSDVTTTTYTTKVTEQEVVDCSFPKKPLADPNLKHELYVKISKPPPENPKRPDAKETFKTITSYTEDGSRKKLGAHPFLVQPVELQTAKNVQRQLFDEQPFPMQTIQTNTSQLVDPRGTKQITNTIPTDKERVVQSSTIQFDKPKSHKQSSNLSTTNNLYLPLDRSQSPQTATSYPLEVTHNTSDDRIPKEQTKKMKPSSPNQKALNKKPSMIKKIYNIPQSPDPNIKQNKISPTFTTQKLPTNIKQSPTQDDLSLKTQEDVDNQIESFESNLTDDSLNKSVNFNEESLDENFLNKKTWMIKKMFGKSPKEGRTATSTKDAKSVMDSPEGVPQIQNKKPSKQQSNDPNTSKEPNVEAERPKTTGKTQTSQITISYATEGFGEPEMTMPTSSIKYLKTPTDEPEDSEDNDVTTYYTTEVIEQFIEPSSEVQMLKQISRPHTIEAQSTDLKPRKENTNLQGPLNKPEDADQMITDKKTTKVTGKDLVDNSTLKNQQTRSKQSNVKALKLEAENLKMPNQKPYCKISTEVSEDFIDRPSPIETYDKQAYKPEAIKTTHFTDQSFRQPILAKQKDEAVGKQLDEPSDVTTTTTYTTKVTDQEVVDCSFPKKPLADPSLKHEPYVKISKPPPENPKMPDAKETFKTITSYTEDGSGRKLGGHPFLVQPVELQTTETVQRQLFDEQPFPTQTIQTNTSQLVDPRGTKQITNTVPADKERVAQSLTIQFDKPKSHNLSTTNNSYLPLDKSQSPQTATSYPLEVIHNTCDDRIPKEQTKKLKPSAPNEKTLINKKPSMIKKIFSIPQSPDPNIKQNKISPTSTAQKLPTNNKQSPTQVDLSLKNQKDVDSQIEFFESNFTDDSLNKSVNFNEESLDENFLDKKTWMIKKVFGKSSKEGRTATNTKDAKSVMDSPEGVPQIQNKKPSKPQSNVPNTTKEPNVEAERPKTTDKTQTSQITISYATEGFGEPEMTMPTSSIKYLKTPTDEPEDSEDNDVTTYYTTEVIEQLIEPPSEVQMLKQISRPHTIETQSTDLRPRKENTNRQGPLNKPEDADQMITDKKTTKVTGKDLRLKPQSTEYNPKQTTSKQSNVKALKLEAENLKMPNQKPYCKISTEVSEDFIDRPSPIETYDKQAYKPEAIKSTHFTDQSFRQPTLAKQKDEAVGKQLDEPSDVTTTTTCTTKVTEQEVVDCSFPKKPLTDPSLKHKPYVKISKPPPENPKRPDAKETFKTITSYTEDGSGRKLGGHPFLVQPVELQTTETVQRQLFDEQPFPTQTIQTNTSQLVDPRGTKQITNTVPADKERVVQSSTIQFDKPKSHEQISNLSTNNNSYLPLDKLQSPQTATSYALEVIHNTCDDRIPKEQTKKLKPSAPNEKTLNKKPSMIKKIFSIPQSPNPNIKQNKNSPTFTTQKLPTNIKQSPTQDDLSLKTQEDVDNQIESFESNFTDDSLNKLVDFNEESLDENFLNKKTWMIKKVFGKSPKEGRTATSTKDAKSVMDSPEGVPQIQNKKPSKPQSNDPNTTKEPNVEAEKPKTTDKTQTSQITISYATEGFGEPEMTMPTSSTKYLKIPTDEPEDSEDNDVTTYYTTEVIEQFIEPPSEVQMLKQISRPHTIETQSTDLRPRKENTNRQGPLNKPEDADQMITDKKTTGKDLVDNSSVQPTEYNPNQTTSKQSNVKALKLEAENLKMPNQKPYCKISTEVSEDFIDRPSPIETYDKQAYKPEAIKTTHFTDQSFRQPILAIQKDEAVGKQLDEPSDVTTTTTYTTKVTEQEVVDCSFSEKPLTDPSLKHEPYVKISKPPPENPKRPDAKETFKTITSYTEDGSGKKLGGHLFLVQPVELRTTKTVQRQLFDEQPFPTQTIQTNTSQLVDPRGTKQITNTIPTDKERVVQSSTIQFDKPKSQNLSTTNNSYLPLDKLQSPQTATSYPLEVIHNTCDDRIPKEQTKKLKPSAPNQKTLNKKPSMIKKIFSIPQSPDPNIKQKETVDEQVPNEHVEPKTTKIEMASKELVSKKTTFVMKKLFGKAETPDCKLNKQTKTLTDEKPKNTNDKPKYKEEMPLSYATEVIEDQFIDGSLLEEGIKQSLASQPSRSNRDDEGDGDNLQELLVTLYKIECTQKTPTDETLKQTIEPSQQMPIVRTAKTQTDKEENVDLSSDLPRNVSTIQENRVQPEVSSLKPEDQDKSLIDSDEPVIQEHTVIEEPETIKTTTSSPDSKVQTVKKLINRVLKPKSSKNDSLEKSTATKPDIKNTPTIDECNTNNISLISGEGVTNQDFNPARDVNFIVSAEYLDHGTPSDRFSPTHTKFIETTDEYVTTTHRKSSRGYSREGTPSRESPEPFRRLPEPSRRTPSKPEVCPVPISKTVKNITEYTDKYTKYPTYDKVRPTKPQQKTAISTTKMCVVKSTEYIDEYSDKRPKSSSFRPTTKPQGTNAVNGDILKPKTSTEVTRQTGQKTTLQRPGRPTTGKTTTTNKVTETYEDRPRTKPERHVVTTTIHVTPKKRPNDSTCKTPKPRTVPDRSRPTKPTPLTGDYQNVITTKSITINNDLRDQNEVIVNLQRSESSREPTPNRICPRPASEDDDTGTPRYPDQVSEPEETGFRRSPAKLSDIPSFKPGRTCRHPPSSDTTRKVDRVEDTDECLLSVNQKVNKFVDEAVKLNRPGRDRLIIEKDIYERPKSPRCENYLDDEDENYTTVSEKVSQFVGDSERIKKPKAESPAECIQIETEEQTYTRKVSPERPLTKIESTPKSSRTDVLTSNGRLTSTETIRKAKELFENIAKEERVTKQRDILNRPSLFDGRRPKPDDVSNTCKIEDNLKSTRLVMKQQHHSETDSDVPGYLRPLDRSSRPRSPYHQAETVHVPPHHRSPSPPKQPHDPSLDDVPHYMWPLKREESPTPLTECRIVRSRESTPDKGIPGYMRPLDRRPKSPDREEVMLGTVVKRTSSGKIFITSKTVTSEQLRKISQTEINRLLKTHEVEEIYDLEVLEVLLERATHYEQRRRIRSQIRIVKQLITENKISIVTKTIRDHSPDSYSEVRRSSFEKKVCSERVARHSLEKNVFQTELRRTCPTTKIIVDEKPSWVTQPSLKKVPCIKGSVEERQILTTSTTSKHRRTDDITSGYGMGPTDENGTPLFGLKALRAQNKTGKTTGTVIKSHYYSEDGKEPVGEISVTKYSSDPKDFDEMVDESNGLVCVTTTQKFGTDGTPSRKAIRDKKHSTERDDENKDYESINTTKVTRRGSVKEMSKKFIESAVETSKHERQSSYPKAGLILRTSSFKDTTKPHGGGNSRDSSPESHESVRKTSVVKTSTTSSSSSGARTDSFLGNKTRVKDVQDVIIRMKNSEEDDQDGDTLEDREARSLLNKFIGSQVILSGMETHTSSSSIPSGTGSTTVRRTTTTTTTTSEGSGKPTVITRTFTHPISEEELASVEDEQTLQLLLERSTDYEERQLIRARLREVMSEQEECADAMTKSKEESSGRIEETNKAIAEGPATTTQVTTTRVTSQQQVSKKPMSPFAKFRQLDKQNSLNTPPGTPRTPTGNRPMFRFTDPELHRQASTVKERLLQWCQMKTKEYENVQLDNFSGSWADGLAFCALIHHFLPDAFDYHSLTPSNRRHNFTLAFRVADEKADIAPLLDVDDMVATRKPDWKCVFTYVQTIYSRFKNED